MEKLSFCFIILFSIITDFSAISADKIIIHDCYNNVTGTQKENECLDFTQAQIKSVSDQGIADVQFSAPLACEVDKYTLTLKIANENITDQNDCANVTRENFWHHSEIEYFTRINASSELLQCNATKIIQFSEVYTGCYRVIILGKNHPKLSEPKFLKTKFKMDKINEPTFDSTGCRNNGNLTCFIQLTFNNRFNSNKIHFNLTLLTNDTIISVWKTHCLLNEEIEDCAIISNRNTTLNCTSKFDDPPKINCSIEIMPEATNLTLKLVDESVRCTGQKHSVWGSLTPCQYNFPLQNLTKTSISITTSITPIPRVESNSTVIVVVIVIILITICVIFIIYIRRRRIHETLGDPKSYNALLTGEQENEHFDIFLVYARDCDVVMQMMKAFKLVLEEFTQCVNVYDIHDPSTEQELSSSPEDWLFSRLSCPSSRMKTLLLATRCGDFQLQHPSVLYKQPGCHDNLFPLAVRVIGDGRHCMAYDSLFVVNFSGDNQEYESFACFTPGRRFALPESLHALLAQLGCSAIEESNAVMQRFHERCREMKTFFTDYPKYLADVLKVSVEGDDNIQDD